MDTTIQLSVHEILTVSSEISRYLHDQTRKRRIPVDSTPILVVANVTSLSSSIINADVNSGYLMQLYACPLGHVKVTIDQHVKAESLLDNGSEVNMMPRHIFERTNLPIDTEIR
jgi:hypothetical protein